MQRVLSASRQGLAHRPLQPMIDPRRPRERMGSARRASPSRTIAPFSSRSNIAAKRISVHSSSERVVSAPLRASCSAGRLVDNARLALLSLALVPTLRSRRFVNYHIDIAVSLAASAQIQVDIHAIGSTRTDTPARGMAITITITILTARSVAETGRRRGVGRM